MLLSPHKRRKSGHFLIAISCQKRSKLHRWQTGPVMNSQLCPYSRTRGNQSAIDGMNIKSATKTKSATKNGSVPM